GAADERAYRRARLAALDDLQPPGTRHVAREAVAAGRRNGRRGRLLVALHPRRERSQRRRPGADEETVPTLGREQLDELIVRAGRLEGLAVLVLVLGDHETVVERVHGDDLRARAAARLEEAAHVPGRGGIGAGAVRLRVQVG